MADVGKSLANTMPRDTHNLLLASVFACVLTLPVVCAEESVAVENEDEETVEHVDSEEQPDELSPIEKLLMREPTDEDYEATVKCVNRRQIRDVDVLSDRFILIEMQSKEKYLIQLKRRCMGIKRGELIRIDARTGRFCKGDTVRGVVGNVPGMPNYGTPCRVPGFEPINDVQLEQLKLGLASKTVE